MTAPGAKGSTAEQGSAAPGPRRDNLKVALPVAITNLPLQAPQQENNMDFGSLMPWRERSSMPSTRRDDMLDPLVSFRREVDRMFDDFFNNFGRGLRGTGADWRSVTPTIDVAEDDKELVVTAELPGLDEKDFEVTLSGDVLTIKGEKRAEQQEKKGGATYMERRFGSFARSIRLPFEVRDEKVNARYDKGVLTIRVPKPPEVQRATRRIDVTAA
jgi:HSP20 family protein